MNRFQAEKNLSMNPFLILNNFERFERLLFRGRFLKNYHRSRWNDTFDVEIQITDFYLKKQSGPVQRSLTLAPSVRASVTSRPSTFLYWPRSGLQCPDLDEEGVHHEEVAVASSGRAIPMSLGSAQRFKFLSKDFHLTQNYRSWLISFLRPEKLNLIEWLEIQESGFTTTRRLAGQLENAQLHTAITKVKRRRFRCSTGRATTEILDS